MIHWNIGYIVKLLKHPDPSNPENSNLLQVPSVNDKLAIKSATVLIRKI